MNSEEIKHVQRVVGLSGDEVDGFWGPISQGAAENHLYSIAVEAGTEKRFPKTSDLRAGGTEFGPSCQPELVEVELPFDVFLYGDRSERTVIKCAMPMVDALQEALVGIWKRFGTDWMDKYWLRDYFGCYN